MKSFAKILRKHLRGSVTEKENMAKHTSLKVGGNAEIFFVPVSSRDVVQCVRLCFSCGVSYVVLGCGSNVLVSDNGVRGVVIRLPAGLSRVRVRGQRILAETGAALSQLRTLAFKLSLSGLEFTVGIPGSLGGALASNAGTLLGCMEHIVEKVTVVDSSGKARVIPGSKMQFGYRDSLLQKKPCAALNAVLKLRSEEQRTIAERLDYLARRRSGTQPLSCFNAGSVFKNPRGQSAAWLIENAGGKGLTVGDAEVSSLHANFIVNRGMAKAGEVFSLIQKLQERVYKMFSVLLDPEIRLVGVWGRGM